MFETGMAKYLFLVNYLRERIENDEYLDRAELKRILVALDVKFKEKEKKENE